ncbi:ATP-binding cassette domain-containing protein [Buchananella hordeovulneris]|uniref:ATP-binding cassette domain-containing protein n=1 Tax=Buchananella hordeovulneris TaxID=52770 RepID=UPI000F5FD6CF|nr:ATP-binding cassette domain-containing protein [Buchananella hordeovulneris]RRD52749.1 ATP-binding cassette domain-containing protein [Buchananella hordeovulneris]
MVHDTQDMIEVDALRRVYPGHDKQDVVAVDDVSMRVPRGQTLAVLGPNGAGKTTLMKMLTTLLPPTSGTALVAGMDVTREARRVRSLIGYVGQGNSAGNKQRARDEVIAQARIYGADRATAARRAAELFTTFNLDGMERRRTQEMSGGQRRRLDLAMGLVHHPSLLFLDEPTTGLDPQNRANLWNHIRQIRDETGMTVVVTTHYLDEADAMADRILIVDHGRILADGTATDLKQAHVGSHIVLETADESTARNVASRLHGHPDALDVTTDATSVRIRVRDARSTLPALIGHASRQGITVTGAHAHEPTLDDVFLTLTGRNLRDAATTAQESQ